MAAKANPASDPVDSTSDKPGPGAAARAEIAAKADEADDDLVGLTDGERTKRSERIIQDHVLLGVVSGVVPGPAIDIALGFGIQLTMLARLAKLYGVPFRRGLAKKLITTFFASLGGVGAGLILASTMIKAVPGVGTAIGIVSMSVSTGAFTYAIGKVFQRHFETDGTFIDLDPRVYGDYFREMFKRGKTVAKDKAEEARAA